MFFDEYNLVLSQRKKADKLRYVCNITTTCVIRLNLMVLKSRIVRLIHCFASS